EADFARLDPQRKPKMLVVCEDTSVSPLVSEFLRDQGLADDDVLTVDSGKKEALGEKEWLRVRQQLFDVDRRAQPRVIVSVLMLREGVDVNSIGDLIAVELRPDYEKYDFAIPFTLREAEDTLKHLPIDVAALQPFTG